MMETKVGELNWASSHKSFRLAAVVFLRATDVFVQNEGRTPMKHRVISITSKCA